MLGKLLCLLGFHRWDELFIFDVDEVQGEFIRPTGRFGCIDCSAETGIN